VERATGIEPFIAAFETVEAGAEVAGAFATHVSWPMAVLKAYRAACSVFSALVERMTPLEYVTAVILSQHKEGIDEAALIAEVDRFLENPNTMTFGWHLGLTARMVEKARKDRYEGWLGDLLGDRFQGVPDEEWYFAVSQAKERGVEDRHLKPNRGGEHVQRQPAFHDAPQPASRPPGGIPGDLWRVSLPIGECIRDCTGRGGHGGAI
jgi:hypothetical protein